ncbi:hypothetical protein pb186bvf_015949 [Paramecium bursaria]
MQVNYCSKNSNTGRAIMLLSQLNEKNKDDLLKALESMKADIQNRINDEIIKSKATQSQQFNDNIYYQKKMDALLAFAASIEQEMKAYNKQRAKLESDLQNKQSDLEKTQKQQQQIEKVIEQDDDSFQKKITQINRAISTIDEALKLLGQAKESSFIEANLDTYVVIGENLLEILEPQHLPIGQSFLDLAQYKFAEQEVIRKSTRILNKIRNEYADQRISMTSQNQAERKQNDNLVKLYQQKSQQLKDEVLKTMKVDLVNLINWMGVRQSVLDDCNFQMNYMTNGKAQLKEEEQMRFNNNAKLLQEYTKELQIIDDCIAQINKN